MTNATIEATDNPVGIHIARFLLLLVAILFFAAVYPTASDSGFAIEGLLALLGLISLLFGFTLLAATGRKVKLHGLALIAWIPMAIAADAVLEGISRDRADAFVDVLNDHMSRSGGLPSNEAELAMAKLALPTTLFGSPMKYRTVNIYEPKWEYAISQATKTKWKIDKSKPVFVVSFPAGAGWTVCERLSQAAVYVCDE